MFLARPIGPSSASPAKGRLSASGKWLRHHLLVVAAVPLGLALVIAATAYYFTTARFVVSTDDSYVQADSTIVASRVSGYISEVLVNDDESVHARPVLARIDDRDFRAALDQARADAQAAQAEVDDLRAQLTQQGSLIARARASVAASESAVDVARLNQVRYQKMAQIGFGSQQQSQESDAEELERSADLQRDRAAHATDRSPRENIFRLRLRRSTSSRRITSGSMQTRRRPS